MSAHGMVCLGKTMRGLGWPRHPPPVKWGSDLALPCLVAHARARQFAWSVQETSSKDLINLPSPHHHENCRLQIQDPIQEATGKKQFYLITFASHALQAEASQWQ